MKECFSFTRHERELGWRFEKIFEFLSRCGFVGNFRSLLRCVERTWKARSLIVSERC